MTFVTDVNMYVITPCGFLSRRLEEGVVRALQQHGKYLDDVTLN